MIFFEYMYILVWKWNDKLLTIIEATEDVWYCRDWVVNECVCVCFTLELK